MQAVPVHGKGVGAVLEEGDAVAVAGVLDRVHIGELAAHVGDEAKLSVWVGDGLTWFFSAMTVLIMQKNVSALKISLHACYHTYLDYGFID